jgi:radical SAM enzyme (TIGR01210 family)
MNNADTVPVTDSWILSKRGKKNKMDPFKPYGWLIEKERTALGKTEDTAIVFLTNRECPFHCLMCDLWKNTIDETLPGGAIAAQIESIINHLQGVKHIKLYNSGSFFDRNAIPPADYYKIASLLKGFETVIVESHPAFINRNVLIFAEMLEARLEVAMGLETVHPEILPKLNKQMDQEKFEKAVRYLRNHNISTRAFILLKTPFMSEEDGIYWAERSIDFAFGTGVECCTVIPVRAGNGSMEYLAEQGLFRLPRISSLEKVLEYGISLGKGRVFADTWDLSLFSGCSKCMEKRSGRITLMNLTQQMHEPVMCTCGS